MRDLVAERDLRELGRRLRELAESSPIVKSGLPNWYVAARELERDLAANGPLCLPVPHFVWHYLADADIRVKDEVYRADQQVQIFDVISSLERGELPPSAV